LIRFVILTSSSPLRMFLFFTGPGLCRCNFRS
jgi:hypothetical protein